MAIRFTCPAGHRLKVPDEKMGRGMLCPVCQESVIVPGAGVADPENTATEPPSAKATSSIDAEEESPVGSASAAAVSALTPPLPAGSERAEVGTRSIAKAEVASSRPWGVSAGLLLVIAYSALPAVGHLRDTPMPSWTREVLAVALLQTVFVVWMLIVRHWAAMVVVTLSFAVASVVYAVFTWLAFTVATDHLGGQDSAHRAAIWSATVLAVYLVTTYLCGLGAINWRRRAIDELA